MDGIIPTSLLTDEWRQMFLETLESVSNEAVVQSEDDESFPIPACHELGLFIKYANGVQDPDFRCSGICPFEPVPPVGIKEYAFKDHSPVIAQPAPDIASSRKILRDYLQQDLLPDDFMVAYMDENLEVKVAFGTGIGNRAEHAAWYNAYAYCRRFEDEPGPEHKDWAWRVVVFSADYEDRTLYGRKPVFDSIPESLDWYSSWMGYLDLEQMRRDVLGDDEVDTITINLYC